MENQKETDSGRANTENLSAEDKGVISRSSMAQEYHPERPSYIVGIGASAGGLEALQTFFNNMPPESGLAFVVVQHLSPDYKSLMVELLSKHTEMEVLRVEDGIAIRSNCVYLIPPKKNMAVHAGNLYLSEQTQRHGLNLPIDVFFRSLAEDQEERAIGVILSGTGSDGTRGVRAIKGEGGMVMVQDEESAKFDGMPKSAIATGLADYILPPERMPPELLKFINHPYIAGKKEPHETMVREEDSFSRLLAILRKKTNVDFTYYKPTTVVRRIERRMGIVQAHSIEDYITCLHRSPKEVTALFKDLLIGVTKFFRDTESYEMLRNTVIPLMVENAEKRKSKSIRVWVAGCSTGEEAYSIAMVLRNYIEYQDRNIEVKVFATDIDKEAIEFAGIGLYPDSIAADVEVEFLSRYFEKKSGGYQVKRSVREMVVFALQNLIKDPPFTKIDLISCRNLLIYFQPMLQKKVLSIFNYALLPDGYLFLGTSETTGEMADSFNVVDSKHRIYKHRGQGALPLKDNLAIPRSQEFDISAAQKAFAFRKEPPRRFEKQENYYHALINKIVPTLLIVNEERELVQSFGNSKRYLDIPLGNITLDILMMLPRELSLAVSSAIHRARKEKKAITYDNIRIKNENGTRVVNVKAELISEPKEYAPLFMILLEDAPEHQPSEKERPGEKTAMDTFMDERINDLEQEIQFTRENLQATIEELQTSNEELQATNEELLAANEELQSTNEELQSVNEELNTVNAEYQAKVIELTLLNNDMNNLMRSTDIGTVFLDKNLCIRKFTPAINREINLLEQDIGRPLSDLSIPIFGDQLLKDAKEVIATLNYKERLIYNSSEWFLLRILPFMNEQDMVDGAVITLINITDQKNAENALEIQYDLLKQVLETSPSAQIMVNKKGEIKFANTYAEELLGFQRNRLLKMRLDSPEFSLTDLEGSPDGTGPLEAILKTGKQVDKYIMCLHKPDNQQIVLSLSGNPTFNEKKEVDGAVFKFDKVAHQTI
jgi:two-component system CheB/CheR fusion protein